MDSLEKSTELPWWVFLVNRFVAVFLVGAAGIIYLRASKLITSMELVPGKDRVRVLLKVRRNVPLPFIAPRRVVVDIPDVTIERKVVAPMELRDEEIKECIAKGIQLRLSKRIRLAIYRFFAGAKQFFDSSGIIYLYIKGQKGTWKLSAYGNIVEGGRPFHGLFEFDEWVALYSLGYCDLDDNTDAERDFCTGLDLYFHRCRTIEYVNTNYFDSDCEIVATITIVRPLDLFNMVGGISFVSTLFRYWHARQSNDLVKSDPAFLALSGPGMPRWAKG
jgi:hypothetical protein